MTLHYQEPTNGVSRANKWGIESQQMGYQEPTNGVSRANKWGIENQQMGYREPTNGVSRANKWYPIRFVNIHDLCKNAYLNKIKSFFWIIMNGA